MTRVKRFTEWKLEWEPGRASNITRLAAHWVLAELIGRASDLDFRDFIEQRVTTPLDLPLLLGIPEADQHDIAEGVRMGEPVTTNPVDVDTMKFNDPAVRAAGVPGGGGLMTAATMARFYQGVVAQPERTLGSRRCSTTPRRTSARSCPTRS